jgi:hypothetical protein
MEGGETSFPRWLNGNTTDLLKVKPKVGKAILFYNQLPDGNYDERSQHAAEPVIEGEKWLTNLWVWVSSEVNWKKCVCADTCILLTFFLCSIIFFIELCQDPYM